MERIQLKKLNENVLAYDGKTVTVAGWAKTIRDSKAFGFIELNDGSCFKNTQIVFERANLENYDEIAKENVGCALIVTGVVVSTPENKQPYEIKATEIIVEGKSTPDYPLQKKRHSVEFLREIAYLRPRTNLFGAAFRIRSEAAIAVHKFFNDRGFVYVHTPILTGSDCEGAGAMFQVTTLDLDEIAKNGKAPDYKNDFFGKRAALTVSGQLNAETYAMAFGNVYTFGPTFRAEHSNTARHAAEFWMIEPEMAFCDLAGDMDIQEAMVKYIIEYVSETCKDELNFLNQFVDKGLLDRLKNVSENAFVRLTYTEAIEVLKENGFAYARTCENTTDVTKNTNPYRLASNCHFKDGLFWKKFQEAKANGVGAFYFWGHSYEMMDSPGLWQQFEDKIAALSADPDVVWVDVIDLVR